MSEPKTEIEIEDGQLAEIVRRDGPEADKDLAEGNTRNLEDVEDEG